MKRTRKTLMTAVVAVAMIAAAQTMVFAQDTSSEASETEALIVSGAESGTEATTAATEATETTTQGATTISGNTNVNQSPNTGVGIAPAAAALLAAASVPVILKTRKK